MSAEDTNKMLLPMYNALRSDFDKLKADKDRLEAVIAELQKDKARLDCIQSNGGVSVMSVVEGKKWHAYDSVTCKRGLGNSCRAAIDAAREDK